MDPVDAGFPGKPGIHPRCNEFHHLLFNDMYGFISWRRREILMDL